jgi:hypothetical protein
MARILSAKPISGQEGSASNGEEAFLLHLCLMVCEDGEIKD